jgi:hypothetical protein
VSLRIPSSSRSLDHDPRRTIYYLGYPLGRFAGLKHRQLACAGSSSTTSPMPRVQVTQHVARLVTRLVAPLVVDYFAYVTCSGASARHAAHRAACVDYFAYAARLGASARRAARHPARRATRHRLLHLAQARRRLLHLCRAFGCLGTSRGSSRGSSRRSSSTTSPMPRIRVPRHVALLVTPLALTTSPTPRIRVPRHVTRLVTLMHLDEEYETNLIY